MGKDVQALILTLFVSIFTGQHPTAALAEQVKTQKNECLLGSRNCMNQSDDIRQRMRHLEKEIKKGHRVYTPQELKKLNQELRDAQEQLRTLEHSGN